MVEADFFFNDTATTEIYTLSLHDALPIYDHLSPRLQSLLSDAKKLKERFRFLFVGPRTQPFGCRKMKILIRSPLKIQLICLVSKVAQDLLVMPLLHKIINKQSVKVNKLLLSELLYFNYSDLISTHGQFNNILSSSLPTKNILILSQVITITIELGVLTKPSRHFLLNYIFPKLKI